MLLAEIEFLQKREIELENESVCLRSKIAEMERFQQANWARVECNPCINFSEFLQPCYHRGWWHCLLSSGQEDTPSRVSKLDTGDQVVASQQEIYDQTIIIY
ncbi:hypothetical protein WN944_014788 [Citrus x changshan-huyou]|uniref:Uncharacterized protein n=1 Tax=Citrus x changshan-huyou TaxID=2935761 RepID=A0AAP0QL23_9ROSI